MFGQWRIAVVAKALIELVVAVLPLIERALQGGGTAKQKAARVRAELSAALAEELYTQTARGARS